MRGASDSFALKKKYHSEKLLNQITFYNPDIREEIIFLEKMRYELLGSKIYIGIKKNIQHKWLKLLSAIKSKKQFEKKDLVFFTLTQFFLDSTEDLSWKKNDKLLKKITTKENIDEFLLLLNSLSKLSGDQKEYSKYQLNYCDSCTQRILKMRARNEKY